MVYRLTISYLGTAYAGWQRQPNAVTVQQRVEEAIAALAGDEAAVVGAGRTDAGVHARGQAAHVELGRSWPDRALIHGVNHHLPEDIRIVGACRMREGFHARRCARAKEYSYRLIRTAVLSPLDAPLAVRADPAIDVDLLRRAADLFVGRHDFSAFAVAGGGHRDPRRTIREAAWHERHAELVFRVVGDGFLRGMVRSLVGTLLEVGSGKRSPDDLTRLLAGADRAQAGPTAPPQGLVLERVDHAPEWFA